MREELEGVLKKKNQGDLLQQIAMLKAENRYILHNVEWVVN